MKVLLWLAPLFVFALSIDNLHICTVADKRDHPTFFFLEHSCAQSDCDLEVIGEGLPYFGNGTKFIHMRAYLDSLPEDDIVLFTDAFDTMVIKSKEELLETFLSFNSPLVLSGGRELPKTLDLQVDESLIPAFDLSTPAPFINSGGYVGYVWRLKEWMDSLDIDPKERDQPQVHAHYANHKESCSIDTECSLFLTLKFLNISDIDISHEGTIELKENGATPGVIHANWQSFDRMIPIYKRYIQSKESRLNTDL